jgi:hypothetical protein
MQHYEFGAMGVMEEYSDPRKIVLDYDRKKTPRTMEYFSILRMCGLRVRSVRDDRTRKGWHRTILLHESLAPPYQVAIQMCLGSDRRRECLNLMRVMRTRLRGMSAFEKRRWNILYRVKLP